MRERAERAQGSFQTILILVVIPLGGMGVFLLWNWWHGGITPEETVAVVRTSAARAAGVQTVPAATMAPAEVMVPSPEPLPRVTPRRRTAAASNDHERRRRTAPADGTHRGDIVLIIDDLGFDGQPLERLMALDPNLNVAILPNGTHASQFARRLHERGFEVLCHLPMQPQGRETPGRNAILASMSDEEIARTTRENIDRVPHAIGVNNHMGSLATADRRVMASVLGAIPDGMYFIDSRTGGSSVAASMAREMNVRTATRHVFLDDVATERAVRAQLSNLADAAEKRGIAVGIGHPYAVTLRVLAEELPALRERGFRLVRASAAVR